MGDVGAAPDEFEKELRRAVPDVLRLAKAGAVPGIGTETLRLSRVERERGAFSLRYVAYDGATAVALLSVTFGRLEAGASGVKAVLYDLSTGTRGLLPPAARLLLRAGTKADVWEVCKPIETTLTFEPIRSDTCKSFRAEMGLVDFASEVWANRICVGGKGDLDPPRHLL